MNRPRRPLTERLRDLVAGKPVKLELVKPKGRASGPRLVVDLPPIPLRCHNQACREPMLEGSITLHGRAGLCGKCAAHDLGSAAPELRPYGALPPCERPETPDEPPQHAA